MVSRGTQLAFRRWLLPLLAAVLLFPSAAFAASSDQAVAYQLDPAHDGYQTGSPITAPLSQIWSVNLGGSISYPLIVNGVVYVTVANSGGGTTLYAVQQATGSTLWSHALGGTYPWSALAYDGGRVFTVNTDGTLTAFDATAGTSEWSIGLPGQTMFTSPPTALDGYVYTGGGGSGGTVYAVSEATGQIAWTQPVENGDHSSPAVDGNGVYVTYACDQDYGFNPLTGAPMWHHSTSCSGGGGKTPVLANGDVFGRDASSGNTVLSASSGSSMGSFIATPAPAVGNGTAYMVSGGKLTAVGDSGLGTTQWTFSGDGKIDTAPLLVGSLVFVGSSGGNLYAVNASSGASAWSTTLAGGIPAPDEQNVSQPLTGLGAGEGTLIVPVGSTLAGYAGANIGSGTPANSASPTVVGTPVVGQPVGADVGTWTGLPTSYSYLWKDCDASGTCSNISGATAESYTPTSSELGTTLEVSVTASNATGTSSAVLSRASPAIASPPINTGQPTISGAAVYGQTLTASAGTWSPAATGYSYQWLRCQNGSCTPQAGATSSTYTVGAADISSQLEVEVTAVDAVGATSASSQPTATVPTVATTLTLTASANPVAVGQPLSVTAAVSPQVDAGTVTFSQDGQPMSWCEALPVNSSTSTVTCGGTTEAVGEDEISAVYSGNGQFTSSSASLTEDIVAELPQPSSTIPPSVSPASAPPALGAPKNLRAHRTRHRLTVTWTPVNGAHGYALSATWAGRTHVYRVGAGAHKFTLTLNRRERVSFSLRALGAGGKSGRVARLSVG